MHLLEIEINAEGDTLAYLSPLDQNGECESGFRLAGPKAWGGSNNVAKLKIGDDDLIRYIREYAPVVLEKLRKG